MKNKCECKLYIVGLSNNKNRISKLANKKQFTKCRGIKKKRTTIADVMKLVASGFQQINQHIDGLDQHINNLENNFNNLSN